MLVLSRKLGEKIVLPQCGVSITVSAIRGNRVRLGISAPAEVDVYREEVWQQLTEEEVGVIRPAEIGHDDTLDRRMCG
jgi:carbon storage regulator